MTFSGHFYIKLFFYVRSRFIEMAKFDPKVADAFLLANGLKYETVCILTLKLFRVVVNNLHI